MITREKDRIIRRFDKDLLVIEPWGRDSLRVRSTQRHEFVDDPDISALLPKTEAFAAGEDAETWGEDGSTFLSLFQQRFAL